MSHCSKWSSKLELLLKSLQCLHDETWNSGSHLSHKHSHFVRQGSRLKCFFGCCFFCQPATHIMVSTMCYWHLASSTIETKCFWQGWAGTTTTSLPERKSLWSDQWRRVMQLCEASCIQIQNTIVWSFLFMCTFEGFFLVLSGSSYHNYVM